MKKQILQLLLIASASLVGCSNQPSEPETNASPQEKQAHEGKGSTALSTEFAPPATEGTPPPAIKIANLEPAPKSAPFFEVPEGTRLVSSGKPVTSSDDFPLIGSLDYVTDGDKEGGQGYFVELMDGPQWIQIDLESDCVLEAVWVWHTNEWPRAFHDVIVQVSNDPQFESDVKTLFNNDYDNSAGLGKGRDRPYVENKFGKLIDAGQAKGRYVRLYSNGSTLNDRNVYVEVEVYGIPVEQ